MLSRRCNAPSKPCVIQQYVPHPLLVKNMPEGTELNEFGHNEERRGCRLNHAQKEQQIWVSEAGKGLHLRLESRSTCISLARR